MYPKNNASPERIAVGAIYLISDGTIQTAGASVRVRGQGGAWGAGGGTLACDSTSGIWDYIPTQAETNYTSFQVAVYKASCTSACVTIVTTAESTAGTVQVGSSNDKTGYSLTATTGLGNQTADITGNLSGSIGSVTGAVGSVTGAVGSVTGSVGSVAGNVTGSVGSISGVTFPTNFGDLAITVTTGLVSLASDGMDGVTLPADIITAASINTGAFSADAFAANALVAATFAASSLNGKGDWNTVVPDAAGTVPVDGTLKVDIETIKTQAVTCAAGVTFGIYVGGTAAHAVASTALTNATWTGARAGYLDNINGHTAQTGDTYALANGASGFVAIAGYLDTEIATIITAVGTTLNNHLLDIKGTGFAKDTHSLPQCLTATSVTVSDKTGFKLASDGLDLVTAWTVDITGTISTVTALTNWHASVTDWTDGGRLDAILDAAKAVTDKLDTTVVLDGAVYDFTAAALAAAPSGSGLDAAGVRAAVGLASANLDTQLGTVAKTGADSDTLKTLSDQIDISGEGAFTGTLAIDDGSTGLEGAVVNLRRGGVLKASGATDVSGEITDWTAGAFTYDIAVRLDGYQPATDTMTISADGWTKTVSLTAISITPPSNPTDCACAWLCLDDDDAPVAGVVIRARPDTDASGTGYAWSGKTRSATSVAVTGLATINLPQGSKWWIRRDSGEEELFTVPSESTTTTVVSVRGGKRDTY